MKKILSLLICIVLGTMLIACNYETDQNQVNESLQYQAWEDLVYFSIQPITNRYSVIDTSKEEIIILYPSYTNLYDKYGNIIANSSPSTSAVHSWYILEQSENGKIAFDLTSKKQKSYTNRVLNTKEYDMNGFDFSSTNGVAINNNFYFKGNYEHFLKDITFPVIHDATEFESTKILSRENGTSAVGWDYVEFAFMKIGISFFNNFQRAIVKIDHFSKYYSLDAKEITDLDKAFSEY